MHSLKIPGAHGCILTLDIWWWCVGAARMYSLEILGAQKLYSLEIPGTQMYSLKIPGTRYADVLTMEVSTLEMLAGDLK